MKADQLIELVNDCYSEQQLSISGISGVKKYNQPSRQLQLLKQADQPLIAWKPIRDDFNFCRLPYFVASRRKKDRFRNLELRYSVEVNGKIFEAFWEVQHSSSLGLPSSYDRDVWLGIMEIAQELTDGGKRPIPKIIDLGPTDRFLKRIGKQRGGKQIAAFKDALRRLTKTTCFTERAFNCPSSGGYLNLLEPINLITKCRFKGDPNGDGGLHESTQVELSEFVLKNLQSGYIALIDTKYVRSLKTEGAKLLYSLLSYRLWLAAQRGRDFWDAHWRELETYLGVSSWCSLWRAKDELKPVIAELKCNGYIDETSDWQNENFIFKMGDRFIDELRARLNAKDQYRLWVQGSRATKQLSILPTQVQQQSPKNTPEEVREVTLTRQALRMALLYHRTTAIYFANFLCNLVIVSSSVMTRCTRSGAFRLPISSINFS